MAIEVICPGCHKRFKVSEKFAGKKGPCPKCKAQIKIPELEEKVVVHTPEAFGPKDSAGRAVLKPIARTETRFSAIGAVAIGALIVGTLVTAVVIRSPDGDAPPVLLGLGAMILGPLLAFGGYTFLRNDELEPYRGREVWIRSLICGFCYAALWGFYAAGRLYLYQGDSFEVFQLIYIMPPFVLAGAFAAYVSLDLDFLSGVIHYGLYLGVTILLRLIVGLPAF